MSYYKKERNTKLKKRVHKKKDVIAVKAITKKTEILQPKIKSKYAWVRDGGGSGLKGKFTK